MHTYALCGYTHHLRTCRYAAILVNRPSGISQAAAIADQRNTKNVSECTNTALYIHAVFIIHPLEVVDLFTQNQ